MRRILIAAHIVALALLIAVSVWRYADPCAALLVPAGVLLGWSLTMEHYETQDPDDDAEEVQDDAR